MDISYELDHIVYCTSEPRLTINYLTQAGFKVGSSGTHNGQGTSNTVFYFNNAYFEILWSVDEKEILDDRVKDTNLWERTRAVACPFGIAFRFKNVKKCNKILFPTWPYKAPFLPQDAAIPIVTFRDSPKEPLIFISLVTQSPSELLQDSDPKLIQFGEARNISHITIYTPHLVKGNKGINILLQSGVLTLSSSEKYLMEIEFDYNKDHKTNDFTPKLPLIFKW